MTYGIENDLPIMPDIRLADTLLNAASKLRGASEALAYRAAAEDDDMLALLESVINGQADILQAIARGQRESVG